MAQTGYTPISIYYSSTSTNVPTTGNLVAGELAINTADGKLFYKDSAGVVQVIAGKGGAGVAGGSNTQVQYNSSGSLAGSANMTFNGTKLTLANDASISGLTVGKGVGSVASNTAVGFSALQGANSGTGQNTAIGYNSLYTNSTGAYNTAVGINSLFLNTTGQLNYAGGYQALYFNTTGSNNIAVGGSSLQSNTTGSNNTAVGYQAGGAITTGSKNSILGSYNGNQGGLDIRTANNYIVLSDGDGNPRQVIDSSGNVFVTATGFDGDRPNATGIAVLPVGDIKIRVAVDTQPALQFYSPTGGGAAVGSVNVGFATTSYNTSSDYRLKDNIAPMTGALNVIQQLKPVTYNWKSDGSKGQGFIAHELQAVVPDCVTGEKDAVETVDDVDAEGKVIGTKEVPKYQGIDTSFLVATLTAAIQEQQALITDLQARLTKAGL